MLPVSSLNTPEDVPTFSVIFYKHHSHTHQHTHAHAFESLGLDSTVLVLLVRTKRPKEKREKWRESVEVINLIMVYQLLFP